MLPAIPSLSSVLCSALSPFRCLSVSRCCRAVVVVVVVCVLLLLLLLLVCCCWDIVVMSRCCVTTTMLKKFGRGRRRRCVDGSVSSVGVLLVWLMTLLCRCRRQCRRRYRTQRVRLPWATVCSHHRAGSFALPVMLCWHALGKQCVGAATTREHWERPSKSLANHVVT